MPTLPMSSSNAIDPSDGSLLGAVWRTSDYEPHVKILTGWSSDYDISRFLTASWGSAATVDPDRFGLLQHGYLTMKSQMQRMYDFYAGNYNPGLSLVDFVRKDTMAVGEVSALQVIGGYTDFAHGVYLIAGQNDTIACKEKEDGGCALSIPATFNNTFPSADVTGFSIPNNTGHSWSLHYSAAGVMEEALNWLDTYMDNVWPHDSSQE